MRDDRCDLLCLDLEKAEVLRRRRLPDSRVSRLASCARALADPTRAIIAAALLQTDELCVCDLAWVTERPIQAVSCHLGILRTAGSARGSARPRPPVKARRTSSAPTWPPACSSA